MMVHPQKGASGKYLLVDGTSVFMHYESSGKQKRTASLQMMTRVTPIMRVSAEWHRFRNTK
jgi:hypothetical protein